MEHGTDLLTTAAVAQILGRGPRTILRLAHAGLLATAHRLPGPNGAFLFDRAEVESLVAQRKAGKE